ncbi:glycoside hydrolase family 88 protein [Wocania ichthyoenteri]|uniref:glycoside hydrolase family 88 protein n=1 Tax=Wocania ichthyoenteri TaxID=1230531 RepID=UPI001FCD7988|nr:glycoside hydrolase family 88 protein [Wocania ichthyoenteri]
MSVKDGVVRKERSSDWTSGFFPGNLWLIYELTGNMEYMKRAIKWTALMEKEKHNAKTHDTGFMINCSFGTGFRVTGNEEYKEVILETAKSLSKRFDEKVGCIRSWDFGKDLWEFPVIIDNMINLELLFEATKISGDSTYYKIAVQHANTTLKNHFRKDNSTYHVIDYNPSNGFVNKKMTHQGYNDESSWARGQAWAIYGYIMAYRYTNDSAYLKQAEATTRYYLNHINLPKDGIPYWDFEDPNIPNSPRDVSASAIVASALFELYSYTKKKEYLNYSKKVLEVLKSDQYMIKADVKGPFILGSSTGNFPANDEIDEPIVYADYYFLEALLRNENQEIQRKKT